MMNKNISPARMRYQTICALADNPPLQTTLFDALNIDKALEWDGMSLLQIILAWMYCKAYTCQNVYQSITAMSAVETIADFLSTIDNNVKA